MKLSCRFFIMLFMALIPFLYGCNRPRQMTVQEIDKFSSTNIQALVPIVEIIYQSDSDTGLLIAAGNKLLEYKNPMDASFAFHKVLQQYPHHEDAKVGLVKVQIALFNVDSAYHYLNKAGTLPEHYLKELQFAITKLVLLDTIDRKLSTNPSITLLEERASLLTQMGKHTAAAQDYLHLFDSTHTPLYAKEAFLSYMSAFEFKESLKAIKIPSLYIKLEEEQLYLRLADSIARNSDLVWQKIRSKPTAIDYVNLAKNFSRIKLFSAAHLALDEGNEIFINDPNILNARVILFLMENKKESALQLVNQVQKKGIKINPYLLKQLN